MQISRPIYINILLTTNLKIFRHNVKGCRSQKVKKDYYNGHMIMFSGKYSDIFQTVFYFWAFERDHGVTR